MRSSTIFRLPFWLNGADPNELCRPVPTSTCRPQTTLTLAGYCGKQMELPIGLIVCTTQQECDRLPAPAPYDGTRTFWCLSMDIAIFVPRTQNVCSIRYQRQEAGRSGWIRSSTASKYTIDTGAWRGWRNFAAGRANDWERRGQGALWHWTASSAVYILSDRSVQPTRP